MPIFDPKIFDKNIFDTPRAAGSKKRKSSQPRKWAFNVDGRMVITDNPQEIQRLSTLHLPKALDEGITKAEDDEFFLLFLAA